MLFSNPNSKELGFFLLYDIHYVITFYVPLSFHIFRDLFMELESKYKPSEVEPKWYQYWLDNGMFNSKPDNSIIGKLEAAGFVRTNTDPKNFTNSSDCFLLICGSLLQETQKVTSKNISIEYFIATRLFYSTCKTKMYSRR